MPCRNAEGRTSAAHLAWEIPPHSTGSAAEPNRRATVSPSMVLVSPSSQQAPDLSVEAFKCTVSIGSACRRLDRPGVADSYGFVAFMPRVFNNGDRELTAWA